MLLLPWRSVWQPTPVFLPGESHGLRNLAGYSLWVTESRTWLKWLSMQHAHHVTSLCGVKVRGHTVANRPIYGLLPATPTLPHLLKVFFLANFALASRTLCLSWFLTPTQGLCIGPLSLLKTQQPLFTPIHIRLVLRFLTSFRSLVRCHLVNEFSLDNSI